MFPSVDTSIHGLFSQRTSLLKHVNTRFRRRENWANQAITLKGGIMFLVVRRLLCLFFTGAIIQVVFDPSVPTMSVGSILDVNPLSLCHRKCNVRHMVVC